MVAYLLLFIILFVLFFIITDTIYFYLKNIKERGKPSRIKVRVKKRSLFLIIFRDFPRLMGRYLYDRQGSFDEFGIVIFYGPQGCGKTMSVTHYAKQIKKKYPSAIIGSNYDFVDENFKIIDWQSLVNTKNIDNETCQTLPIIFCFDEVNQWAYSRDWVSMPKNVLGELAFQRKNKRVILGTAQSIGQIDKEIRRQVSSGEYRRPFVIFDFIVIVFRFKCVNDDGEFNKKRFMGFYIYFQDEEMRNSYDTNKVIEKLASKKYVKKD